MYTYLDDKEGISRSRWVKKFSSSSSPWTLHFYYKNILLSAVVVKICSIYLSSSPLSTSKSRSSSLFDSIGSSNIPSTSSLLYADIAQALRVGAVTRKGRCGSRCSHESSVCGCGLEFFMRRSQSGAEKIGKHGASRRTLQKVRKQLQPFSRTNKAAAAPSCNPL